MDAIWYVGPKLKKCIYIYIYIHTYITTHTQNQIEVHPCARTRIAWRACSLIFVHIAAHVAHAGSAPKATPATTHEYEKPKGGSEIVKGEIKTTKGEKKVHGKLRGKKKPQGGN